MKCRICDTRKPKRQCPGVSGDICGPCCGQEREVTVDCPLDCQYLNEARAHEKLVEPAEDGDFDVPDGYIRRHEEAMLYLGFCLSRAAMKEERAVDADVREALDALAVTYRSKSSGIHYEARPVNPYARGVYDRVLDGLGEYEKVKAEGPGATESDWVKLLGVWRVIGLRNNNGRPRGRAFLSLLRKQFPVDLGAPDGEGVQLAEPGRLIEL